MDTSWRQLPFSCSLAAHSSHYKILASTFCRIWDATILYFGLPNIVGFEEFNEGRPSMESFSEIPTRSFLGIKDLEYCLLNYSNPQITIFAAYILKLELKWDRKYPFCFHCSIIFARLYFDIFLQSIWQGKKMWITNYFLEFSMIKFIVSTIIIVCLRPRSSVRSSSPQHLKKRNAYNTQMSRSIETQTVTSFSFKIIYKRLYIFIMQQTLMPINNFNIWDKI